MVSNLQDSVLKTVHHEISETLKKTELRLSDAFEFEETSVPEEVSSGLSTVRDSLLILGEATAAELTSRVLELATERLSQQKSSQFKRSDIADAFLVLSEYVESDDHGEHESVLQAALANISEESSVPEYSDPEKEILNSAAQKLKQTISDQNAKVWQLTYKIGGGVKKLAKTRENYDFWWLLQEISRLKVQGEAVLAEEEAETVLKDALKLLEKLIRYGDSSATINSTLASLVKMEESYKRLGVERADYHPPSMSAVSSGDNIIFPVSKKTIEDVAFLVKREISIIKNLFEQSEQAGELGDCEAEIADTLAGISATFELFGLSDVVEMCELLAKQLKSVNFDSGKYVRSFAENTVKIEDSLWALSYASNQGIKANNYTQNIALNATKITSAEQFNRYFRTRRDDIITGKFEFTEDAFMQAAASIHEMYSTQLLLQNGQLAAKLQKAEGLHLFLANKPDTLKDKKALNSYISLLVTFEIIFEDIMQGSELDQRSSALIEKSQTQLNSLIKYNKSEQAMPNYSQDSEFASDSGGEDNETDFEIDDSEVSSIIGQSDNSADLSDESGSETLSDDELDDINNYEALASSYGLETSINSEVQTVDSEELESDMLEIFVEEAHDIHENLGDWLDVLSDNPHDEEQIGNVRRAFHTIKGSGRMVGLQAVGEFGWQHEELLNKVISNEIEPNKTLIKTLKVARKLLGQLLEADPFVEDAQALLQGAATAQSLREYMLDNGEPELINPIANEFTQNTVSDSDLRSSFELNDRVNSVKEISEHPALKDAIKDIIDSGDLKRQIISGLENQMSSESDSEVSDEETLEENVVTSTVESEAQDVDAPLEKSIAKVSAPTQSKLRALASIADILSRDPDVTQADMSAAVKSLDTIDEADVTPERQALLAEAKALGEAVGDVGDVKSELGEVASGLSGALSALSKPELTAAELKKQLNKLQDMRQAASEVRENVGVETLAADTVSHVGQEKTSIGGSDAVKSELGQFASPLLLDFYESTYDDVKKSQENYDAWESSAYKGFDELSDLHKNIENINKEAQRTDTNDAEVLTREVGGLLSQLESDEIVPTDDIVPPIRDAVNEIQKMHSRLPKGEDAIVNANVLSEIQTVKSAFSINSGDIVNGSGGVEELESGEGSRHGASEVKLVADSELANNENDAQVMTFNSTHLESYYNELIEPLQSARQNYSDWAKKEFNISDNLTQLSNDFGTISSVSQKNEVVDAAKVSETVSEVLDQIASEDLLVSENMVKPIDYSLDALEKMHKELPLGGEAVLSSSSALSEQVRGIVKPSDSTRQDQVDYDSPEVQNVGSHDVEESIVEKSIIDENLDLKDSLNESSEIPLTESAEQGNSADNLTIGVNTVQTNEANTQSDMPRTMTAASFASPNLQTFYESTTDELDAANQNLSDWKSSNFTNQQALSSLQENVEDVNKAGEKAELSDAVELTDVLSRTLSTILEDEINVDSDTVKPVEDAFVDLQAMHAALPSGGAGHMPLVGLQHVSALEQLSASSLGGSDVMGSEPNVNMLQDNVQPVSATPLDGNNLGSTTQTVSSGPVTLSELASSEMSKNTTMTFGSEQLRHFFEEARPNIAAAKSDFEHWEESQYQDDAALDSLREHVDSVTDAGHQANLSEAAELSGSLSEALAKIAEEDLMLDSDTVKPIKDAVNAVDALHQSLPQGGSGQIPAQFESSLNQVQEFVSMISAEELSQMNPAAGAAVSSSNASQKEIAPAQSVQEGLTKEKYDDILKQLSGQVFAYNTEVKRSGRTHEEIIESIYELESQLDERSVPDHLWEVLSALENAITSMKKHGRVPTGRTQEIIEEILQKFKHPESISEDDATPMINELMAIRADIEEMTVPMARDRLGEFEQDVSSQLANLSEAFESLKQEQSLSGLHTKTEALSESLSEIKNKAASAGYSDGEELADLLNKAVSQCLTSQTGLNDELEKAIASGISMLSDAVTDIKEDGQGAIAKEAIEEIEEVVESEVKEKADIKFNDAQELDETILEIFIDEAKNILVNAADNIDNWSSNPHDQESLNDLKRNMHTLKGSARMAELTVFGDLTHEMENLLDYITDDRIEDIGTASKLLRRGHAISEDMVSIAEQLGIVEENPNYLDDLDAFMAEQTGMPRKRTGDSDSDEADKAEDEDNHIESETANSDGSDKSDDASLTAPDVLNEPSLNVSDSMSDFETLFDADSKDQAITRPIQVENVPTTAEKNDTSELDETILDIFTDEAKEILSLSKPMVDAWDATPEDTTLIPELRRDMHTLKGGARMAELTVMGNLAQAMETMLDDIIDNKIKRKARAASILVDAQSLFESMVKTAEERGIITEDEELLKRYHELNSPDAIETKTPVSSDVQESDQKLIPSAEDISPESADTLDDSEADQLPTQIDDQGIRENDTSLLDSDILDLFTEEAHSILEKCRQYTDTWSENPKNYAAVQGLQRSMHTLKGGARMAELTVFGNTAHEVENVLDMIADGQIKQKPRAAKLLQEAQRLFEGMIETAELRGVVKENAKFFDRVNQLIQEETGIKNTPKGGLTSAQLFAKQALDKADKKTVDDAAAKSADDAATKAAEMAAKKSAEKAADEAAAKASEKIANLQSRKDAVGQQTDTIKNEVSESNSARNDTTQPQTSTATKPSEQQRQQKGEKEAEKSSENISADIKTDKKKQAKKRAYTVRVGGETLERLTTLVGESVISRSRVERNIADHGFQLTELARTVDRIAEQLRRLDSETEAQILFRRESILDDEEQFDPLELDRFSEIQQLSRSLSESVNDLQNIRQTLSNHVDDTRQLLSQEKYIQQEIQELLLSTSMVRFDSILPRIERIVYQVSEELGKEVELQIFGGQIEIERNMIEDLLPGFEHSIRNSLAHGIEKPDVREEIGKPRAGLLRIGVKRDGAEVIFVITDDGKGADYDKIVTKARQMGILDESKASDKKYLANLMFGQGFSTADKTTQVAGRGIGMDVLRDVVSARKGSIDIETESGKGLATSIRLPFSMSVTDALLIKTGRFSYAVPSVSIEGTSKMQVDAFEGVLSGEEVYQQYGQYRYRVLSLTKYFDPSATPEYAQYGVPLLLVRIGSERIALEVEQVVSRQEITIKSVNQQMNNIPGIIGASILDTGDPIAVLEAATVARQLWDMQRSGTDVTEAVTDVAPLVEQKLKVLHVDDSITMRKITAKMLSKYELEAKSAKDGLDAIDLIQEWTPDVILLDIEMPRMDGFEFATHVRNRPELNHVPIVMITSRTGEKHRERAMKIGANGYMGKPYREDLLIEEIERLLSRKLTTV